MLPRFVLFFATLFVVLGVMNAYVHRRASALLGLDRRGRRALAAALAGALALMLGARLLSRALPAAALEPAGVLGATVQLGVLVGAVLLAVVDLARALGWLGLRALRGREAAREPLPEPPRAHPAPIEPAAPAPPAAPALVAAPVTRRSFLSQAATGSALLVGGGSSIYGALVGRHDYEIAELQVRLPGLPKELDGYTLVQLSDIHLGLFVGEPEMRAAEELVKKAKADLVVFTGDLVDHDGRYVEALGRLTRRLAAVAPGGVVAVPGNHDYYAGIDETLAALRGAGARVLRNDGCVIGSPRAGFALLGVDDVWAGRVEPRAGPDLDAAIAAVPPDLPRILLCHNPVYFPKAAGKVALQLSGHTHGGQVNVLVRPADWVLPHGYVAGLYARRALAPGGALVESQLYVNRGFGTAGPPARVGAPPELTRVVLVAG